MTSDELDRKIRECALQAIVVLRKRGHCKSRYQGSKGELCLYGALAAASNLPPGTIDGLHTYVADRIIALLSINRLSPTWIATWQALTSWNDEPKRTVDDVIKVLEKIGREMDCSVCGRYTSDCTCRDADRIAKEHDEYIERSQL